MLVWWDVILKISLLEEDSRSFYLELKLITSRSESFPSKKSHWLPEKPLKYLTSSSREIKIKITLLSPVWWFDTLEISIFSTGVELTQLPNGDFFPRLFRWFPENHSDCTVVERQFPPQSPRSYGKPATSFQHQHKCAVVCSPYGMFATMWFILFHPPFMLCLAFTFSCLWCKPNIWNRWARVGVRKPSF